jgi:bifunctional DNase/RNase
MILISTTIVGGVMVGMLKEAERNDYVTLEIDTYDKIEIIIQRDNNNPTILFTFDRSTEIIEAVDGVFNVSVTVKKISGDNPVIVIVKDRNSRTLFNRAYVEPEFTINLKDIV